MKITNNSDQTLYADGLIIFKSAFMTVDKYDYTPDIMATHFSVDSGLILPGSGTDYPGCSGGLDRHCRHGHRPPGVQLAVARPVGCHLRILQRTR